MTTEAATAFPALAEPLAIGGLSLPNRIVMAPMTRYFSPGGTPGADVAEYYARRARAGVGLLITEGTYPPHPSAHGYEAVPQFYGREALAGWQSVVAAVHAAGGRIFPQLWHTGPVRELGMMPAPEVPGFVPSTDGSHLGKAMSDADIADVITAYAQAASDALAIGFDGVEIHGAHGYLIDTFLWDRTNRRADAWGGNLVERGRFACEIVRAIRAVVGPDFPISFRWSQFKQQDYRARLAETPGELEPLLRALGDAGVSIFHASARRFWEPAFPGVSDLSLAGWTRRLSAKPTIAVGSVGLAQVATADGPSEVNPGGMAFSGSAVSDVAQLRDLERRLAEGEFDLIAVGRSILADPEWTAKVLGGRQDERIAFSKDSLKTLI